MLANKRFNWLPGSLFHELDHLLQQEFYDLLQELKRYLISFLEIGKSYGVGSYDPPSVPKQIAGGETQIIDNEERAKAHQKAITWVKKVVWSAKDKKTVSEIVEGVEHWTDLLRMTIQDVVTISPGFRELDGIDHVRKSLDEQAADLQQALTIRRIMLTKPMNLSEPAPVISMTDVRILSKIGRVTLGRLHSSQVNILIEKKLFGEGNHMEDVKRLVRFKHLTTLIQHATDLAWRMLTAQGYNYDLSERCATIVYEIPGTLLPSPINLQQLYKTRLQEARPPLEIRFQLLLVVTESLFLLHSLGWVHKSFSSSLVLFFPQRNLRPNPWPADGHAQEQVSIEQILCQSDINIAGFELSRPEAEQSSLSIHGDTAENFYRHPARCNVVKSKIWPLQRALGVH